MPTNAIVVAHALTPLFNLNNKKFVNFIHKIIKFTHNKGVSA